MKISRAKLNSEARSRGFRVDVLEKVLHLLNLLDSIQSHPFLKDKLVLKGGTALNLFIFNVPRLSVDIDLNYIGAEDRDAMLVDRPKVDQAIEAVFSREGFNVRQMPDEHAGGKWKLQYQDVLGQRSNLEVDLNFMFRVPLWSPIKKDSRMIGQWQAKQIPLIDVHELAAGKIAALIARCQARDLFDCHKILQMPDLDHANLRIAFVLYGAMNRKDWRMVSVADVQFDPVELERQLVPTLSDNEITQMQSGKYGAMLVEECRKGLSAVLPFTDTEKQFLDLILDKGEIVPSLLTTDEALQYRISRHPVLQWKAINVHQHKNIS